MASAAHRDRCVFVSDHTASKWDGVRRRRGEPRPLRPLDAMLFEADPGLAYIVREFEPADETLGHLRGELPGMFGVTTTFRNGVTDSNFWPIPLHGRKSFKPNWQRAFEHAEDIQKDLPGTIPDFSHLPRYAVSTAVMAMQ